MRALWCPNHNTNPNPNPNYNRVKKEYILGSTIESRLFLKSVSKRDSLPRSLPPPPPCKGGGSVAVVAGGGVQRQRLTTSAQLTRRLTFTFYL